MADAQRDRLARQLLRAAERFGVRPEGAPVRGDFDRTLAVRTSGPAWLRVTTQRPEWTTQEFWNGVATATGGPFDAIPMPRHLRTAEWSEDGYVVRADLVTYVDRPAVGSGLVLRQAAHLPGPWWDALRTGLEPLRHVATERMVVRPDTLRAALLASFGVAVDLDRVEWQVAHGDLHFGNLTAAELTILDWETWGRAPAGYDAAVLACSAVLRPDIAARVRTELGGALDTYSGAVAQLAAADKYLGLVRIGRHPDVAVPLRRHAEAVARDVLGAGSP